MISQPQRIMLRQKTHNLLDQLPQIIINPIHIPIPRKRRILIHSLITHLPLLNRRLVGVLAIYAALLPRARMLQTLQQISRPVRVAHGRCEAR